jgi:uncharacterized protein
MRFSTCFLPKAPTADARQLYGAVADRAKRCRLRRRYDRSFEIAWRTENFGEAWQNPRFCLTVPEPMPSIEPLPLVVAMLTFLTAGFVKGVIGLGLPTVSMGLLSVVMPPAKAASLLIVPSFVTNVWQLAAGASFTRLAHRLWPMLAGVVLGTLAGTGLLTGSHAGQAAVALGLLLMLYAVLGLTSVRFSVSPAAEWWLGPLIGALTGLATAATGVFAIPAVPYLGALNLDKEDMIQALGLSFTVSTIALAVALAAGGAFALGDIGASTAALAPALLGMAAGGALRGRFSEQTFRRVFFGGLLVLGAHLASRAVI